MVGTARTQQCPLEIVVVSVANAVVEVDGLLPN